MWMSNLLFSAVISIEFGGGGDAAGNCSRLRVHDDEAQTAVRESAKTTDWVRNAGILESRAAPELQVRGDGRYFIL